MWIIPRTSRFCRFAPGTAASSSDWPAHWRTLLESLQWRSKPTPWRTWLLRLRRVNWLSRLCGRTCEPSRRKDFEDALISSLLATRAHHSAWRAGKQVKSTTITSGHTSGGLLLEFNRNGSSLKMCPIISTRDFRESSKAWNEWVSFLHQDCTRRLKQAQVSGLAGFSFWPRPCATDTGVRKQRFKQGGMSFSAACMQVHRPDLAKSPTFREWLMMVPIDWTAFDFLETE